jgi:hypothetical protein
MKIKWKIKICNIIELVNSNKFVQTIDTLLFDLYCEYSIVSDKVALLNLLTFNPGKNLCTVKLRIEAPGFY